jgi:hypothetical protein
MDGVGPATESRDCVHVGGRRPAGHLGAARVATCELGDWHLFRMYADRLNWYMPAAVPPAAAVLATAGEVLFVIALITGFRLREAAIGVRSASCDLQDFDGADPRNEGAARLFRVTAATASFSLVVMAADHKREIREGGNHESTVER